MDGSGVTKTGRVDGGEEALRKRYDILRAEVAQMYRIETGQTMALPYAAAAYGEAMGEGSLIARATHAAQLVCIAAAGIFPILLVLRVLF